MSNLPELSFKPRSLPARVCVKKLPRHVLHYIKQCAVPEIIHNPHPPKPPPTPQHTHTHTEGNVTSWRGGGFCNNETLTNCIKLD